MEHIRTKVNVNTAQVGQPSDEAKVKFHEFRKITDVEQVNGHPVIVQFKSSKIIPAVGTEGEEGYVPERFELIKLHTEKFETVEDVNTLASSITLTETDYVAREIELLLKSAISVIVSKTFFGISNASDLEIV